MEQWSNKTIQLFGLRDLGFGSCPPGAQRARHLRAAVVRQCPGVLKGFSSRLAWLLLICDVGWQWQWQSAKVYAWD